MKEKNLMWIAIFVVAIGLIAKIIFDNYKQATEPIDVCYIDAPKIIEKLAVFYSLDMNKSLVSSDSMTREKADILMKRLRAVLNNPYRYHCKTIFMKGAVLSGGKDITKEVLKDVWGKEAK
ncbi:hypothetical protein PERMA_A0036 (plasmid) [Persephonella marina EX-H1]|uniref:Uncharacterized protein n=1 Tax=Persephonella marina (strain DSM 14350 / EX-H1) TaxID=123214 RepID=C0QUW5_PERMH|nr:hypothetical protein [Persephonella marina]ACO04986.1 hypothetical protein PERMA_A0036 [Persephonella marina EX-H1]